MTTQEILKATEEELVLVRPAITVYETEREFLIEAEMPGASKEKIEVSVEDNHLILSGRRNWNLPDKSRVLYQETFPVEYYRDLVLGKDIKRDGIHASFENGILKVRLQKSEKAAPQKVVVQ